MKLNDLFYIEEEFMDWLANNYYSYTKLKDDATEYNNDCELEKIISHSNLDKEISENLTSIITEKGKLCKCKNFVVATAKTLLLFMIILALTGCVSKKNQPTVYRRKIEFYKPEKLKVLYSMPEEEELPEECYKINFPDTAIAEMMLNTHKLRKINANTQKWILLARREIKKAHAELARRKAEIAKIQKKLQKIKEMRKELKQIEIRIENAKKKRQEEKEKRLRS